MNVLVVVDMQKDFIDGALGTKEAAAMLPKLVQKMKGFDGEVIFTMDTHSQEYLETQEGKNLPVVHCVKGTKGWELPEELQQFVKEHNCKVFEKPAFGSVELGNYIKELHGREGISEISIVGVCTDICVISNVMIIKAAVPEVKVVVDSECCAGVTVESHERALDAMKMCQVTIL